MSKSSDSVSTKVQAIFEELVGARASVLHESTSTTKARDRLAKALRKECDFEKATADELAFHMLDWNSDAAFVVAMLLFPERFKDAELTDGTFGLLVHAPNHLLAAARLADIEAEDVFRDIGWDSKTPE